MNDRELADAVVALGVGRKTEIMAGGHGNQHPESVYLLPGVVDSGSVEKFVRDPRVAMALMELLGSNTYNMMLQDSIWHVNQQGHGRLLLCTSESLSRAIIEACVEALTNE